LAGYLSVGGAAARLGSAPTLTPRRSDLVAPVSAPYCEQQHEHDACEKDACREPNGGQRRAMSLGAMHELVRLRPTLIALHRNRHDADRSPAFQASLDAGDNPLSVTPREPVTGRWHRRPGVDLGLPVREADHENFLRHPHLPLCAIHFIPAAPSLQRREGCLASIDRPRGRAGRCWMEGGGRAGRGRNPAGTPARRERGTTAHRTLQARCRRPSLVFCLSGPPPSYPRTSRSRSSPCATLKLPPEERGVRHSAASRPKRAGWGCLARRSRVTPALIWAGFRARQHRTNGHLRRRPIRLRVCSQLTALRRAEL
jgi:hypothetical protein